MSDTIDRQAAINEIEHHIRTAEQPYQLTDANRIMNHAFEIAASCIYNLPDAQPERKTARWIEDGYSHYKAVCSECGEPCATYVVNTPRDRFCKWCGAKMEVGT